MKRDTVDVEVTLDQLCMMGRPPKRTVTLTRSQVENALAELNKPEEVDLSPGRFVRWKGDGVSSVFRVVKMVNATGSSGCRCDTDDVYLYIPGSAAPTIYRYPRARLIAETENC